LIVDVIAAEYKVGREFERELRTTAWWWHSTRQRWRVLWWLRLPHEWGWLRWTW
jgi:hypothetical protein